MSMSILYHKDRKRVCKKYIKEHHNSQSMPIRTVKMFRAPPLKFFPLLLELIYIHYSFTTKILFSSSYKNICCVNDTDKCLDRYTSYSAEYGTTQQKNKIGCSSLPIAFCNIYGCTLGAVPHNLWRHHLPYTINHCMPQGVLGHGAHCATIFLERSCSFPCSLLLLDDEDCSVFQSLPSLGFSLVPFGNSNRSDILLHKNKKAAFAL